MSREAASQFPSRPLSAVELRAHPNPLAPHYSRFRVSERLLLTGHSHQAWPDRGFEGQCEAWEDAAREVDDKWERAFAKADAVRRGYARLLDDPSAEIALATSTHDLLVRFLSALPLRERPRVVTTAGEFHSARRQLDRLGEEGIEVVRVPAAPAPAIAERLAAVVDDRTAAVYVSCVLYGNAHIVRGLGRVLERCRRVGAELMVDAYHAVNVLSWSVREEGLEDAFVIGGGYKYCQLGEGNAFLRVPPGRSLRPVVTGWFSEFQSLTEAPEWGRTAYGSGATRFAGATYDPTSHYRAASVFRFFDEQGLTPALLRTVSRHQVGLLTRAFDDLDLDPRRISRDRSVSLDDVGGFLALRVDDAGGIGRELRSRNVWTDWRGDALRLGPAPYLSDLQLLEAVDVLGEVLRARR